MKPVTSALFAAEKHPVITAHSGCEGTPSNSIEHIKAALDSGAEMLEVDIRRAADGRLFLSHDVREDYAGCPSLEDCFALVAPSSLSINCDVKTVGLTADVMALAEQYGMADRVCFTGNIGDEELPALNETVGDWWLSLWRSADEIGDTERACQKYDQLNGLYRIINLDYHMICPELLAAAEKGGCPLSVWTVDREKDIRAMMAAGVWNITTRQPKLALAIRNELFGF